MLEKYDICGARRIYRVRNKIISRKCEINLSLLRMTDIEVGTQVV